VSGRQESRSRDDPLPLGPRVDPTPAPRPLATTLSGRWCLLRPLDVERDSDALYRATHGPQRDALWAYLSTGPYPSRDAFSEAVAERARSTDPLFFAIEVEGEARGWCSLMRVTPEHRVIEVGHVLFSPTLQRTPAATEAIRLLAHHVFEDLGYRRFEWKCDALNAPSRRAALRLGFTFESVFRQHMIVKGRSRDTAWYAMLDDDWPTVQRYLDAWLAPENFDAAGRQLETLAGVRSRTAARPRPDGSQAPARRNP
jgi:RimJ/RimL family protein N-acetyltransferase